MIVERNDRIINRFANLATGDSFEYCGDIYIKTDEFKEKERIRNTVRLNDGEFCTFSDGIEVYVGDIKIVVGREN